MMRHRGNGLDALIDGLRGVASNEVDWQSVIALANHALLTPALCASLAETGQLDRLPGDVREYLEFVHNLNRDRNLRLRAQLAEAVATLNRCGIVPMLLKGAVPLFLSSDDRVPRRMTSDLDICVEQTEVAEARSCLQGIGYVEVPGVRDMARPQDVGVIELRPRRPSVIEQWNLIQLRGGDAKIPSTQARAWHWIAHDLLKEGDYWRGRIDLRHLHDLAELSLSDGVDWAALRASVPDRRARNAVDTQLLALHHFFGCEIPAAVAGRAIVRFQHWRRVFTARHPLVGAPLRFGGNLAWGVWRFSNTRDLQKRGTVDLAIRIGRTILGRDLRAKI